MKVETDLKAGAFLSNALNTLGQATDEVGNFFAQAGQQAESLTNTVVDKATGVWNALVS